MSETRYDSLNNLNRWLLDRIKNNATKWKFEPDEWDKKAWEDYKAKLKEMEKEELISYLKDLSISFDWNWLKSKSWETLEIHCWKVKININFKTREVNIDWISFYLENIPIYIQSVKLSYISDWILIEVNPLIWFRKKYKISNDNIYKFVMILRWWAFEKRTFLTKNNLDLYLPDFLPEWFLQEVK